MLEFTNIGFHVKSDYKDTKILILPHLKFAPFFQEKPRTVISGLVKFIPEAEMQNRKAILMCNLKPSKMRGIMSEAMVMCASTPEKVEILTPPEDSKPGDLVYVEGFERKPGPYHIV